MNQSRKHPIIALMLSVVPGLGHMYLQIYTRAILYGMLFFGSLVLAFLMGFIIAQDEPFFFMLAVSALIWGINMLDMLITVVVRAGASQQSAAYHTDANKGLNVNPGANSGATHSASDEHQSIRAGAYGTMPNERFFTIVLSFIPGLGHFQLGLMHRGLTFLVGFFGLMSLIGFITVLTHEDGFLIFMLALPVIWLYSLFDAIQLMIRKQKGEKIIDQTVLEDLDKLREEGKKSKLLATILALFPGAGHLYLGLQRRGIQLMAAFLFSIYILDVLHLSLFLFIIPIIWFYSFFDTLQQLKSYEKGQVEDVPIIHWMLNHQRWVGVGLLLLGVYFISDQLLIRLIDPYIPDFQLSFWFRNHFQTVLVSLILIFGGIKLLFGSRRKGQDAQ